MSVLLLAEIGVPGENHRHAASHLQTLSHNVVSKQQLVVIDADCTSSCKSNYRAIRTDLP